jgi:hypothetical protein
MATLARYSPPALALTSAVPLSVERLELSILKLQRVLIHLGYLEPGSDTGVMDAGTSRAMIRFKRHARRAYRRNSRTGAFEDLRPEMRFQGPVDDRLDEWTLLEIRQWVERGWDLPVGRYRFLSLTEGEARPNPRYRWSILREDVARNWRGLMQEIRGRGASVDGPYGDTRRKIGMNQPDGASPRSFHIPGRAIDLNQSLARPDRFQRYFIVPEQSQGRMFWRILCRTDKQDGSQGRYFAEGAYLCWNYVPRVVWMRRLKLKTAEPGVLPEQAVQMGRYRLPAGYYLDLTECLETAGHFERIPALSGWETNYRRTEWWHYHYAVDKQDTFLDECELVGITEQRLLAAGYTRADLDRRPG